MLLADYAAILVKVIDEYSETGLIIDSTIHTDLRTTKVGVVSGTITFLDDSRLFFTEFLDVRYRTEKLSYSFHYQDKDNVLRFRYDNAGHKPSLAFADHKHLPDGQIIQSTVPELNLLLEEIMGYFL